ncbi:UNVERIFIED_CONTAM: hypothetical protein Sradi_3250900 [Sesamum radiatum]|uniref:Uncharacterized protein n=1 Tax=Sesamum radiatum TaxID=300843 RepID=A0AAW2R016_SESRA
MAQQACSLEPDLWAIEGVADQLPLGTSGAAYSFGSCYLSRTEKEGENTEQSE